MKTLGELYDALESMRMHHHEWVRLEHCGSPRAEDHKEEYEALRAQPLQDAEED